MAYIQAYPQQTRMRCYRMNHCVPISLETCYEDVGDCWGMQVVQSWTHAGLYECVWAAALLRVFQFSSSRQRRLSRLCPLTQQNLPFHIDRQGGKQRCTRCITVLLFTMWSLTKPPSPLYLTQSAAGHETMKEWVIHPSAVVLFSQQSRVGDASYYSI